jgi:hypothetical protein
MQDDIVSEIVLKIRKFRPPLSLMLRLACVFGLVYYMVYTFLFFLSLLFKDFITEFIVLYRPDAEMSGFETILILVAGFLMNAGVVTGLIFMLSKRNIGPFIYGFSATLLLGYQLISRDYILSDKFVVEAALFLLIIVLRIWFSKAKAAGKAVE